ncbi:GNAT family N-acetyltransferase [Lacticaseibacillus absianus]|uniref:GNAT family N-acetyltransferase n=1 Tax=Lacticaseibacillus absianus TaxID=2729623 RepID=UPI0015CC2BE1|nr:GNAT family N-acetyltransferase [Lacticaseibacillus absianus]
MTTYRHLDPLTEEARFYQLTLYAFNRPDTPERQRFFSQLYRHSEAYGAFDAEALSSGFLSIPFTMQLGGDQLAARGISYVSSYPEDSGHGNITALMRQFFNDCQANQVPVAYLAPFSFPFYRRFGFEQVFDRTQYHLLTRDVGQVPLPAFAQAHAVRIVRRPYRDVIDLITPLHNAHPFNRSGGIVREDWWTQYLALKHPTWEVALCYIDDHLEGDVVYIRDRNVSLSLQEFFWTSRTAYWQLLSFIARHKGTYASFDYVSGDPRPRLDAFVDPHTKKSLRVTNQAYMMARIIDLPQFLAQYRLPATRHIALTLTVRDELIATNDQTWHITSADGHLHCDPSAATPDLPTLNIRDLTQLLFGYRRAEDLLTLDLTPEQSAALNALVKPDLTPMLWDYF